MFNHAFVSVHGCVNMHASCSQRPEENVGCCGAGVTHSASHLLYPPYLMGAVGTRITH